MVLVVVLPISNLVLPESPVICINFVPVVPLESAAETRTSKLETATKNHATRLETIRTSNAEIRGRLREAQAPKSE